MIRIPTEFPLIRSLSRAGNWDRGYAVLILCGPVVIVTIALLGRSLLTTALTAGYVLAFVSYLLWNALGS